MEYNDAKLIQRTLDGDQAAFTSLVEKYQKGIHALAWRKIGDFHIAQEITQDAFLRAYERLRTLKDRNSFPGWVYVIASHLCTEWHRKKKRPTQSLENTNIAEIEQVSYSQYTAEKRDAEKAEAYREVVQKLLQRLPESERTVMVLHYLGEMTCETISKMLGVSPNTIKSRLNRARNRLKKEEAIIHESLSSFQLPTQMTENIMKEISRTTPATPSTNKPWVPWVVSTLSAILVLLLIGIGIQHLSRSYQPHDLNSESELLVEIVDTPANIVRKIIPDQRNQLGNTDIPSKNQGTTEKVDTPDKANLTNVIQMIDTELPLSNTRWTQLDSPETGNVSTLFTTQSNDLYAMTPIGLYQLTPDKKKWHLINSNLPTTHPTLPIPITEHGDTLYIMTDETVIASKDKGKTWEPLGARPEGLAIGLIVKDNTKGAIELYLALLKGIFYSDDAGVSWKPLNKGIARRKIYALASDENTLFAGTDQGLYRFNLETSSEDGLNNSSLWIQLPIAETKSIHAISISGHNMYILAGRLRIMVDMNLMEAIKIGLSKEPMWTVFRSTDKGNSWTDITPTNTLQIDKTGANLKLVAAGNTVMLRGDITLRSTDKGNTWILVNKKSPYERFSNLNAVAALEVKSSNEPANQQQSTNVKYQFYIGGGKGIHRSTDGGDSWKRFNTGLGGKIQNLTVFNNRLYAVADDQLITSTDSGQTWKAIPVNSDGMNMTFFDSEMLLTKASIKQIAKIRQIVVADGMLYAKVFIGLQQIFFRLDEQNATLIPIQSVPAIGEKDPVAAFMKMVQTSMEEDGENASNLQGNFLSMGTDILGTFAVSGNTFYVEHRRKLLIWHSLSKEDKDKAWKDTKIEDTRDIANLTSFNRFKLGVSGDVVYVGKPDGLLIHSVDRGTSWKTVSLPIAVDSFKQILINDKTVYVATDKGALYSTDGTKWNIITNIDGQTLMIDRFTADGNILYAVSSSKNAQGGVYRLTSANATWKHITPEIPDNATSLAVVDNILYVGTENRGLQLILLDEF